MTIVTLPDNSFRDARWSLVVPNQVNRSDWTGRRQVVGLPGSPRWKVTAEHVPIRSEAAFRPWRSAMGKLKGTANTFRLRATETSQTAAFSFPAFGGGGLTSTIANNANTTVSGRSVTMTGAGGSWSGRARSTSGATSSARASFRFANGPALTVACGLTSVASGAAAIANIDYGFVVAGGALYATEGGTLIGPYGTVSSDDVMSVVYDATSVRYYRNGDLLRTATTTSGRTFNFDAEFNSPAGQIVDATFHASSYLAVSGFTVQVATANLAAALSDGMMATALLKNGGEQLVTITADMPSDSSAIGTPVFEPPLRDLPFCFVTDKPWGLVALDDSTTGWAVDQGQIYTISLTATEAF